LYGKRENKKKRSGRGWRWFEEKQGAWTQTFLGGHRYGAPQNRVPTSFEEVQDWGVERMNSFWGEPKGRFEKNRARHQSMGVKKLRLARASFGEFRGDNTKVLGGRGGNSGRAGLSLRCKKGEYKLGRLSKDYFVLRNGLGAHRLQVSMWHEMG